MNSAIHSFSDLVDAKRIKDLLTSFYDITGIPSTLIDLDGNILTTEDGEWVAAGWQNICLNFHREHPVTLKKCIESDVKLSNGLKAGEKYSCYHCHNGLVDMAVPIYIDGKHLANLFTGQFLFESPDIEFFKKQAEKYGFDKDEYLKALSKVPIFSKEFIENGMKFLTNLANVIGEMGLEKKNLLESKHNLKENQAQLKIAMDLAKLVHWEYDFESDLFDFDDQFYALYGTTAEREGGVQMSAEDYARKFIPPEESYLVGEEIIKALRTEDPNYLGNVEHSIIRADGEKRFILVRFGIIKDEKGRTIKTYGANQDITERKEFEIKIQELLEETQQFAEELEVSNEELQKVNEELNQQGNELLKANKELNESSILINSIINGTTDAIYAKDLNGNYILFNAGAELITGKKTSEVIGKDDTFLFSPNEVKKIREDEQEIINQVKIKTMDEIISTASGEKRDYLTIKGPLMGDNGQVIGTFGITRDITERKNAENEKQELYEDLRRFAEELEVSNEELQATTEELRLANEELRKSEKTLLDFFNNPLNGFALCEIITDANGEPVDFVYLEVNDTFEMFTGLKREEVINKRVNEILDPEEVADIIKIYGNVALNNETADFEYPIPSLDKYYEISAFSPKKGRFIAFFTDITGRKKAEDERDRFFNLSIDMLCISDFNGYFKQLNPAFETTLGWNREELLSRPYIEFIHPDDIEKTLVIAENLLKGKLKRFENRYMCKDGSYKWLSWNAYPLIDEKMIFATVRDITERKKVEDEIKESLREKEILLREIHHRVKNNLQIVSSLLSLQTEFVEGETLDVLIESRNRVQTMAIVHEELYKSSSLKDVNVKGFILTLVSNIFYSYGVKIGTIEREIDVEDLNIGIDTAIPCGLIINELVTNSIKYAFPMTKSRISANDPQYRGTIKIEFKKIGDEFNLIIADNGVGIQDDIEIENSETLGLNMVSSLVNQLDGQMEIDRTNGTKFKIIFKEMKYKDRI